MKKQNLIIIYTGNGKGKTSAALGLVARALREKWKVLMVQFIKSDKESGETNILPGLEVKNYGSGFIFSDQRSVISDQNKEMATRGVDFAKDAIKSGKYQVIILDEVFVAYDLKLIQISAILDLIKQTRQMEGIFLVLTGRGCPEELSEQADLVTEMKEIKHPFQQGVRAIKGIDY